MGARMLHGAVERGEYVVLIRERGECAHGLKRRALIVLYAAQEHGDAAPLKARDDLPKRQRTCGIEHLQRPEPQHHNAHRAHLGQLVEKPLGGTEEQATVQAVHRDVLGQQMGLLVGIDLGVGQKLLALLRSPS
jgi:hypothetical protein